jgi:hypothetical protein
VESDRQRSLALVRIITNALTDGLVTAAELDCLSSAEAAELIASRVAQERRRRYAPRGSTGPLASVTAAVRDGCRALADRSLPGLGSS